MTSTTTTDLGNDLLDWATRPGNNEDRVIFLPACNVKGSIATDPKTGMHYPSAYAYTGNGSSHIPLDRRTIAPTTDHDAARRAVEEAMASLEWQFRA